MPRRGLAALLDADPDVRAEWEATRKLQNDPRISCVGAFLRKTSLDELPQLVNVLKGDMSLVGRARSPTRNCRTNGSHQDTYLSMRPGMTGLWQVSGRSSTTFDERVALDVTYFTDRSLKADLSLLVRTLPIVLLRRGAY